MINHNNTKKYLLYAIGEIILVVIGILIALSINNWNEDRKNENTKNKYLLALSSEIDANLTEIRSRKTYTKNRLSDIHHYLTMVSQAEMLKDTVFANLFGKVGPTIGIGVKSSDFETARTLTSGIYEIQDDSLRRQLLKLPEVIKWVSIASQKVDGNWENMLSPYYQKHANIAYVWDEINGYKIPENSLGIEKLAFHQNKEFINILIARMRYIANLIRVYEQAELFLSNLNDQIKKNLKLSKIID
jgi:hypothetical protein